MSRFDGKTILVIGATAGIGLAAYRQLASEGARVIGVGRRDHLGSKIRRELRSAGHDAYFRTADISDTQDIAALFAWVRTKFDCLDAAINNAAVTQDAYSLAETPPDVYDQLFAVNVRGTWHCLREELIVMQAQGFGAIVNVSSIAGIRGIQGLSVYTASKHAVVGMTKTAALDAAAFGVRVNCLCPGMTDTEMMERQMLTRPGGKEGTLKLIPLGRISSADEQARTALWLLSEDASYITGETIVVDGGRTIR